MRFLLLVVLALLAAPAGAQSADKPTPGYIRVRLVTSAGAIILALDARRAPRTTTSFLQYVDDRRLDGTNFYRASRRKTAPKLGFIQGGIQTDWRRILPPVPHESTLQTGIRHLDATISMARGATLGHAGGNFFLTIGPTPHMDARPDNPGYAAFGRVVGGIDTMKRILAMPTGGGREAMRGQMILAPVKIIAARRMDGAPRPTKGPKPWLIGVR